jgi:hypothetical protein
LRIDYPVAVDVVAQVARVRTVPHIVFRVAVVFANLSRASSPRMPDDGGVLSDALETGPGTEAFTRGWVVP